MKAVSIREIDKQYWAHWQAFLNFAVKAEKGKGKQARPKYDAFEKFFNYQKELQKVLKNNNSEKDEPETISRLREYMKKTGGTPNG